MHCVLSESLLKLHDSLTFTQAPEVTLPPALSVSWYGHGINFLNSTVNLNSTLLVIVPSKLLTSTNQLVLFSLSSDSFIIWFLYYLIPLLSDSYIFTAMHPDKC